MAADSSINDTEAGAAGGEDQAALRDPPAGPPRPPRPAKRMSGSVRIPLPSSITPGSKLTAAARAEIVASAPSVPANSNSSLGEDAEFATEDATATATPIPTRRPSTRPPSAVVTPAVPGDASTNYEFALTRRSSAAPPLDFDNQEVDLTDRAPAAPLTPWRDVPPLNAPPLGGLAALASTDDQDREDTIVGEVPKNLLELSSEEEENTRAYQAPQELIDLARRQREERRQSATGQQRSADPLLPAGRLSGVAPPSGNQDEIRTATVETVPTGDAAPPVARSARDAGSDAPRAAVRTTGGGASLAELARAVSERGGPDSLSPESEVVGRDAPDSEDASLASHQNPWLTRGRVWLLLVGLFIAVGFALARWRGLDLLFSR